MSSDPVVNVTGVQHAERVEVPDLAEIFNRKMMEQAAKLNCCHIGTVKSFDSVKQTVIASINYKAFVDGKLYDYPLLLDVPVFVYSGGGARITMPIAPGDTCILLFNDRSIDNWLTTGDVSSAPNGERVHDLSDAICLVGLFPYGGSIPGYSTDGPEMKQGNNLVKINGSGIHIQAGSNSFGNLFFTWLTDMLTQWIATKLAHTNLGTAFTALFTAFTALAGDGNLSSATRAAMTTAATAMTTAATSQGVIAEADDTFHGKITIMKSATDGVLPH